MNQQLTLRQLKFLLRLETGLVALVVILGMVAYSLSQQVEKSAAEQKSLKNRLDTVSKNLRDLRSNDPKPALRSKLEGLQSTPEPQALPSREQTLQLGSTLVTYASAQGLHLTAFDTAQASSPVASPAPGGPTPAPGGPTPVPGLTREKGDRASINYSMVARGPVDSLVGTLQLLGGFPTAKVQKLEFTRAPGTSPVGSCTLRGMTGGPSLTPG